MKRIKREEAKRGNCYITYRQLDGFYKSLVLYELNGLFTVEPTYRVMNIHGNGDVHSSNEPIYQRKFLDEEQDNVYLYELDEDEAFRMYHMLKIIEAL